MKQSSVIVRNIFSNWTGFLVNAAMALVMTPLVLRHLGDSRYGVWILTSSLMGYYGLLDLGFRAGVNQYLTRYLAVRDFEKLNRAASSAFVALSATGALIFVLSILAGCFATRLFSIPPELEHEVFWCILVVGISSAFQCVCFPFSAVFTATQRYDASNAIGIATRLLSAAAIYASIKLGHALIGVSVATALGNFVDYILRWRVAYRLLPELSISTRLANLASCREIMSFGLWNFLISFGSAVFMHADAMIIGKFMSVAALTHYALAMNMLRQLNSVLNPVGQVFYPAAAESHAKGDTELLVKLYLNGSRLMMTVAIVLSVAAAVWAEDFYRLWVGSQYVTAGTFPSVALLLRVLLLSVVAGYFSNIGSQLLLGAGRVKPLALSVAAEACLNVLLSIVLIQKYGLMGVAIATVAAAAVFRVGVLPVMIHRETPVPVLTYLAHACGRPAMVGVIAGAAFVVMRWATPGADLRHFLAHGIASVLIGGLVTLYVGLSGPERKQFIFDPLRNLMLRWKPRRSANPPEWNDAAALDRAECVEYAPDSE